MHELNNDKLDALFQEGSERYDFTYREDAWDAMDGMLDEQDKNRKKRFLGWWLLVGFTTFVGAFALIKYDTTETNTSKEKTIQSAHISGPIANNISESSKLESIVKGEKAELLISNDETLDEQLQTSSLIKEEVKDKQVEILSNNIISTELVADKIETVQKSNSNLKGEKLVLENDLISEVVPSSNLVQNSKVELQGSDSPSILQTKNQIDFLPVSRLNLLTNDNSFLGQIEFFYC